MTAHKGVVASATCPARKLSNATVSTMYVYVTVFNNRLYSSRQSAKLDALAAQRCVHVVQLQGNVFFGNVQQVVDCVKEELAVSSTPATIATSGSSSSSSANASGSSAAAAMSSKKMYLVLDCTFVSTLDSTAMAALVSALSSTCSPLNARRSV
jgi:ABC-type transporter Mla MlaB component